jgi:hypothetical protein
VECPERLQRCPNSSHLTGDESEIREPFARLILDQTGAEVVEEGVDSEIAAFRVFQRRAESLQRRKRNDQQQEAGRM